MGVYCYSRGAAGEGGFQELRILFGQGSNDTIGIPRRNDLSKFLNNLEVSHISSPTGNSKINTNDEVVVWERKVPAHTFSESKSSFIRNCLHGHTHIHT
jgi:hypothetical protein